MARRCLRHDDAVALLTAGGVRRLCAALVEAVPSTLHECAVDAALAFCVSLRRFDEHTSQLESLVCSLITYAGRRRAETPLRALALRSLTKLVAAWCGGPEVMPEIVAVVLRCTQHPSMAAPVAALLHTLSVTAAGRRALLEHGQLSRILRRCLGDTAARVDTLACCSLLSLALPPRPIPQSTTRLESLIWPMGRTEFVNLYWQRRPLLLTPSAAVASPRQLLSARLRDSLASILDAPRHCPGLPAPPPAASDPSAVPPGQPQRSLQPQMDRTLAGPPSAEPALSSSPEAWLLSVLCSSAGSTEGAGRSRPGTISALSTLALPAAEGEDVLCVRTNGSLNSTRAMPKTARTVKRQPQVLAAACDRCVLSAAVSSGCASTARISVAPPCGMPSTWASQWRSSRCSGATPQWGASWKNWRPTCPLRSTPTSTLRHTVSTVTTCALWGACGAADHLTAACPTLRCVRLRGALR